MTSPFPGTVCFGCGALLTRDEINGSATCPVCGGYWSEEAEPAGDRRILYTLRRIAAALEAAGPLEEEEPDSDIDPWKGSPRRRRPQ